MHTYNTIMAGCGRLFVSAGSIKCLKSRYWFTNSNQFISTKVKKALDDNILQHKPKRPLTPFFKYLQIMRPNIITKYPHYTTIQVVKTIAQQWAEETIDFKRELHKEYDTEYKEYMNKLIEYEKSLTNEDKNKLLALKQKMQTEVEKAKHKNQLKLLGKPKKPPSAFLLYVRHMMKTERRDTPSKVFIQTISSKWKNMTEEDKKVYVAEAIELMEKYRKEKQEWEDKMVKEGHLDILPKSSPKPQDKTNRKSE